MAVKPAPTSITITTAGTRQRILTDPKSAYRFVPSIYFEAKATNTGKIYIGNSSVASTLYTTCLSAEAGSSWNGSENRELGGPMKNKYDLYEIWVDCSVSGEIVMWSVDQEA